MLKLSGQEPSIHREGASTVQTKPSTDSSRLGHLKYFYDILGELEDRVGGKQILADCDGSMGWPQRGVYFFFEDGEKRVDSGKGLRVVRVGTHALKHGAKSTFWGRLSQHRGNNHRSSIFRLLIGTALQGRDTTLDIDTWGVGSDAGSAARKLDVDAAALRERERALEQAVSAYIWQMPFLWVSVEDPSEPSSDRGYIERNSIALLSNYRQLIVDKCWDIWLGKYCNRDRVTGSGLWNNNHVDESYRPEFLERLSILASRTPPLRV